MTKDTWDQSSTCKWWNHSIVLTPHSTQFCNDTGNTEFQVTIFNDEIVCKNGNTDTNSGFVFYSYTFDWGVSDGEDLILYNRFGCDSSMIEPGIKKCQLGCMDRTAINVDQFYIDLFDGSGGFDSIDVDYMNLYVYHLVEFALITGHPTKLPSARPTMNPTSANPSVEPTSTNL